jgi:hypothetical protein
MRVPRELDGRDGQCPDCGQTITLTLSAEGKAAEGVRGARGSGQVPADPSADQSKPVAPSTFEEAANQPAPLPETHIPQPVYQHPYRRLAPRSLDYAPGSFIQLCSRLVNTLRLAAVVFAVGTLSVAASASSGNYDAAGACGLIFGLPLLVLIISAGIMQMILLYRYWNILRDPYPSTRPARVVGFLFIPLFNFYWTYVAIVGLAKQTNDYCDQVGIRGVRINESQAMSLYVIWLTTFLPYINFITMFLFIFVAVGLNGELARKAEMIMQRHRDVRAAAGG